MTMWSLIGERPFKCCVCGKAFNQKNALDIHIKRHSGEKPHICQYCMAAFTQRGNLKTHIRRTHLDDDTEPTVQPDNLTSDVHQPIAFRDQISAPPPSTPHIAHQMFASQLFNAAHNDSDIVSEASVGDPYLNNNVVVGLI